MEEAIETKTMQHYPVAGHFTRAAVSSAVEALLGIGALTLSIIGLAHVVPEILLAVSAIIVGTAVLFESGALAARYAYFTAESERRRKGWVGAIFFGGTSGITLGILGLIGFVPMVLVPVASMTLGASLLLGSGLNARVNALEVSRSEEHGLHLPTASETMPIAFGVQGLVGLGVIGLGLLALAGLNPVVLSLVAMFSIGGAVLMDGAIVSRMMSVFARENREES